MIIIKPYVRKQLFVALCVFFGQILLCFSMSWPGRWSFGGFDAEIQDTFYLRLTHIDVMFYFGLMLGTCTFGLLSNCIGRKPFFLIGAAVCFASFSLLIHMDGILWVAFVANLLAGTGTGIIFVGSTVYLGEIASTNIRGLILLSASMFRYAQNYIDLSVAAYNIPSFIMPYFGLFVSLCFLFAVFFIPESPVFYIIKGSEEDLKCSLISLGRENELEEMLSTQTELQSCKKKQKDHWLEIFKVRSNRMALFLTMTLNLLQCLSGMVSMLYLLPQFVYPIPHLSMGTIGLVLITFGMIGAIFSVSLVEIVGRRTLLMVSTGSCGVSLGLMSTYLFMNIWLWPYSNVVWSYVLLVIVLNYFFSYALGFRMIPEILIGEMFTLNVRSTGSTIVIFTFMVVEHMLSWLAVFIFTEAPSPLLISLLFTVYCLINVFAFALTMFLVPETKGLSLKEVNETLHKKQLLCCCCSSRNSVPVE